MDSKGRFVKGERVSIATEFKKGQHWRPKQCHWDKDWLVNEYITKQQSIGDIAMSVGCTDANIRHWLIKYDIPRRTVSEARSIKQWRVSGSTNGMYGRRGALNPRWKGGITPERQALYSSLEWTAVAQRVWERDQSTCQRCHQVYQPGRKFHVHHITPFRIKHLQCEPTNLVLLCCACHGWVHSKRNTNREFLS